EGVAQVRALRAYYYYRLLDLFGRVKIVTSIDNPDTEDENEADASQSDRAEVFRFVEDELKAVIASGGLPTTINAERFTQSGANALLAKLYLNAEVYTGTAQWQDASDAADEVINSGLYMLTEDYGEVFSPTNSGDPEHILVAPYDQPSGRNGMNFSQMTLHYGNQATYNLAEQPWNGYTTLEDFYNSYESQDERRENNFLVGLQRDAGGNPIIDLAAEGAEDPDGFELNFTPKINELFPNAIRQGGARLSKFGFEDGAQSNMNNDYPILRYGDILLVKAEAEARLASNWSAPETVSLVNQLRARAGVSAYTSLTEDEFLAERGREMFMEASRRQDLIRFGRWGNQWWEKPSSDATVRQLFPIPQEQIDAARASGSEPLTQNPGY
ncbi:MAG: RagB/SusD family nutrient uptake outer membrane protein, partial [Ekhidna sp.]|nr:RagB/SusD family nutrient uptake outer membrane protein [Ekhidna sp.]